jgi:hypothetical protein
MARFREFLTTSRSANYTQVNPLTGDRQYERDTRGRSYDP